MPPWRFSGPVRAPIVLGGQKYTNPCFFVTSALNSASAAMAVAHAHALGGSPAAAAAPMAAVAASGAAGGPRTSPIVRLRPAQAIRAAHEPREHVSGDIGCAAGSVWSGGRAASTRTFAARVAQNRSPARPRWSRRQSRTRAPPRERDTSRCWRLEAFPMPRRRDTAAVAISLVRSSCGSTACHRPCMIISYDIQRGGHTRTSCTYATHTLRHHE